MTSKECLERLFSIPKDCDHCPCDAECNFPNTSCNKLYEIIKKDLDELNQYKQLEEKLDIDLFILFGALRHGIYYKSFDGDIDYLSNRVLTLSYSLGFGIWVEGHRKFDGLLIDFKDYKKTWALAKEELQDDK